jgi:DNA-binding SARP family transcriptional activator
VLDAATAQYVVRSGDTLWSIAQRELGSPLRWREIAALNRGKQQFDGQIFEDDNWILPGWVLELPPRGLDQNGPSPHLAGAVVSSVATGTQTEQSGEPSPSSRVDPERRSRPNPGGEAANPTPTGRQRHSELPVKSVGLGILGAGVVLMLEGLRRAQQRRRIGGRVITLPKGDLADLERSLRVAADVDATSTVDRALRLLGMVMAESNGAGAAPVAVRVDRGRMEFVFDPNRPPGPPAAPFEASMDPGVWVLPSAWPASFGADRLRGVDGRDSPCPALVSLGDTGHRALLVNLENLGSLSMSGADTGMVLEAMTVELGVLPWADTVDVVVVGHPGALRGLERVRQVRTVASAVSEARRRLAADERLAEQGVRSTFDARWSTSDSAWDGIVVVCLPAAADAEPEACRRLVELTGDGRHGVSALIGAPVPGARWTATLDGERMALSGPTSWLPEHEEMVRQPVVPGLLADVDQLVGLTSDDDGVGDQVTPGGSEALLRPPTSWPSSTETRPSAIPRAVHAHEVEVRILGPVDVVGNAKPFVRAWALELVVYLSMHESGASTDQWAGALWPDRLMASASLHSTASSARRSLGTSVSGEDHLPRAHGRLALAATVTTDWAQFRDLAATDEPEQLAEALRLVRGRPFQGLRSTDWALLEGITATIEATVVDAACRLAEHHLSMDNNPSAAEHAARLGLRVSEYDERLYRILLRAADAAGNPAGVESTMKELVHLVADAVEPFDAVHPETLELYRKLSRRAGVRRGA